MNHIPLVIIDMHFPFLFIQRWEPGIRAVGEVRLPIAIAAIQSEVRQAMAAGDPIILVEMETDPPFHTTPEILDLVSGYANCKTVLKFGSSGAHEIADACHDYGYDTSIFRIGGCYTEVCVKNTALGLLDLFPTCRLEMIEDACFSPKQTAIETFAGMNRIDVRETRH